MPAGSYTPRTVPEDFIVIRCDDCGREGRYRRETLIRLYGADTPMPEILRIVSADCAWNEGARDMDKFRRARYVVDLRKRLRRGRPL